MNYRNFAIAWTKLILILSFLFLFAGKQKQRKLLNQLHPMFPCYVCKFFVIWPWGQLFVELFAFILSFYPYLLPRRNLRTIQIRGKNSYKLCMSTRFIYKSGHPTCPVIYHNFLSQSATMSFGCYLIRV